MSNENKPDLSDLKARLGLKKPAAKPTGGAGSSNSASKSGAQSTIPRPDKPSATGSGARAALGASKISKSSLGLEEPESSSAATGGAGSSEPAQPAHQSRAAQTTQPARPAAQAAQPASRSGPPPGAMGPPPTARKKASPASQEDLNLSAAANEKVDLKDLGIQEDVGLGLSAPMMVLLVVLLVMGLFFGFMASQSMQVRDLESRRISDAQRVQTYLEPRLAALSEALEIIEGLDPKEADFDAAQRLSQLDFAIGADVLPNNRVLLGRQIVGPLNNLAAQSNLLHERVREHHLITTRLDRSEIEEIRSAQEDQLDEAGPLALVFNFGQFASYRQDPSAYTPPTGRLVAVTDPEQDDDGMIGIKMIYRGGESRRVEPLAVLMLEEGDLMLSDGDNAVSRYERRVRSLKDQAEQIGRRIGPLQEAVAEVAAQDAPPLLSLSGTSREYEEGEQMDAPVEE